MSSAAEPAPSVRIRRATPSDAQACGKICYEAFAAINTTHSFPPDFPSADVAAHVLASMFSHPAFFCVVAEADGRVVGSNCLDERNPIAGIGPITVDPSSQNRGAGRLLMQAVMDRAQERSVPGLRLVQAAFHSRSLALYTSLGFEVREPLSCLQGHPQPLTIDGRSVRPAEPRDAGECNQLCERVHGLHRAGELADAIGKTALVVEHNGRITGYATVLGFFGHAVAESNPDLQAMIASTSHLAGPGILVPTRNTELLRWCLERGLRIVQPLTLMSTGRYHEPTSAYLPSISY